MGDGVAEGVEFLIGGGEVGGAARQVVDERTALQDDGHLMRQELDHLKAVVREEGRPRRVDREHAQPLLAAGPGRDGRRQGRHDPFGAIHVGQGGAIA